MMLRIPRQALDAAIEAFTCAAMNATNTNGLHVMFTITPKQAEAAVLGALSILAPHGGPCTAADWVFVHTPIGGDYMKDAVHFPPSIPGSDHKREEEGGAGSGSDFTVKEDYFIVKEDYR